MKIVSLSQRKGAGDMTFGYGRCSTDETRQDLSRQERELKAAGAEEIYLEFVHGTDKVKPELEKLLKKATTGDTIIACEVSRLTRSVQQLCELIETVKRKRLCLVIIGSMTVDCRSGSIDPTVAAFLQVSGVFAELERQIIRDRVSSGLAARKAYCEEQGLKKWTGRPALTVEDIPESFMKYYERYRRGELNKSELARISNISRPSAYRYVRMLEGEAEEA